MVYRLLHDLLDLAAVFGWLGGTVILLFWVAGWVERMWLHLCRSSRLDYERHLVEEAIRSIRRRAICEMLAAEREYREGGGGEVIEGTAVEVRW